MPLTRVYAHSEELLYELAEKQEELLRQRKQALDSKTNFFLLFVGLVSNVLVVVAEHGPSQDTVVGAAFSVAVALAGGFIALAAERVLRCALQPDYQIPAASSEYLSTYEGLRKHYESYSNADIDSLCLADLKDWLRDARNAANDNNAAVNDRRAALLSSASHRLRVSLGFLVIALTILVLGRVLGA